VEDYGQGELERLPEWIGRLEAFTAALDGLLSTLTTRLSDGLPPSDEMQQRFREVAADVKPTTDTISLMRADLDAQDAEREAFGEARSIQRAEAMLPNGHSLCVPAPAHA